MMRNREGVEPYRTRDGSTIRELFHPGSSPARGVSVAEAQVEKGQETGRHVHEKSQEIYYVLEGAGTLGLGAERLTVKAGDAVLIPPGTSHNVRAEGGSLRILCICTPPYAHDDTIML